MSDEKPVRSYYIIEDKNKKRFCIFVDYVPEHLKEELEVCIVPIKCHQRNYF